jgi:TonB family protein
VATSGGGTVVKGGSGDLKGGTHERVRATHRVSPRSTYPAARYRDRQAYFGSFRSAKIWTFAPFPEYPSHERLTRTEGVAIVRIIIGADGRVASVVIFKSSGNANLDNAAVSAVRRWHAHKEYAGAHVAMPIEFTLGGRL